MGAELFFKRCSVIIWTAYLIMGMLQIGFGFFVIFNFFKLINLHILSTTIIAVPALTLILFGLLSQLQVCFGCISVCREIICCLECNAVFHIIFCCLQCAIGIYWSCLFYTVDEGVKTILENYVIKEFSENKTQLVMGTIQQTLQCCGTFHTYNYRYKLIPTTCCGDLSSGCSLTSPTFFANGCVNGLINYVSEMNYIIGIINVVIGAYQIIPVILACSLSCCYLRKYRSFD